MKKIFIQNLKIILPTIIAIIFASSMWNKISFEFHNPEEIIEWAKKSLRTGGFILSYVPTVNQVGNLLVSLKEWKEIEVVEVLQREWQSRPNALRPKTSMLGHTGFIISARWNG